MSNTTEDQIVAHLRKLLNDRDEASRKRIADLERDLAHSRVKERQIAAEMEHLREQLAMTLCALENAGGKPELLEIDVSTNDSSGAKATVLTTEPTVSIADKITLLDHFFPLPWRMATFPTDYIEDASGKMVFDTRGNEEVADAIVCAINAHVDSIDRSQPENAVVVEAAPKQPEPKPREYVVTGTHCDVHVDCEAADAKRREKDGIDAEHVCRRDFVMKL